jgi:hypothetical protein
MAGSMSVVRAYIDLLAREPELEGRRVTAHLRPTPMSSAPSRTMVWATDTAKVEAEFSDNGLTQPTLIVTEDDGNVSLVPEGEIVRIEIDEDRG